MKLALFKHQEEVLKQTEDKNKVAYYLDMGLGKTFVGAEKLIQLNEKLNIIVCQKSLIKMWIRHIEEYYPDYIVYNGRDMLPEPGDEHKEVIVINYDLVHRRQALQEYKDYTLLLDESSLIQNYKAKRTKAIMKLNYKNVILLSGTPVSGKYENLRTQANMIGWDISEDLFQRHYVNYETIYVGGFPRKVIDKDNPYKNEERLKQKLRDNGSVFMKTEEVFDLPEQIFIDRIVDNTKEYKRFEKDKYVRIDNTEYFGDLTLKYRLGLRQLAGSHSKDKLETFKDIIQSSNDRFIVFYNFNKELDELVKITGQVNRPYGIINGNQHQLEVYEENDDSILFIQYQAGSYGLNLQKANKIIYFTPPEHSELFEQSKKRTHRIGQDRTCFYYRLIVEDSIEEDIYKSLEQKKDYTDELFRGDVE